MAKPFSPAKLVKQVLVTLGQQLGLRRKDRLLPHIRSQALREAYQLWQQLRGGRFHQSLPRLEAFRNAPLSAANHAFIVAIEGQQDRPAFRYIHVGGELTQRLGRSLLGTSTQAADESNQIFEGLAGAYARCTRTVAPHYDYARYRFHDVHDPVSFERLLLPVVEESGNRPTHLVGLIAFQGPT